MFNIYAVYDVSMFNVPFPNCLNVHILLNYVVWAPIIFP